MAVKKLTKPIQELELPIIIEAFHVYIPIKKGNGIAIDIADSIVLKIEELYQNRERLRIKYITEQRKIWDIK